MVSILLGSYFFCFFQLSGSLLFISCLFFVALNLKDYFVTCWHIFVYVIYIPYSSFNPHNGTSCTGVIFPSLLQLQRGITDVDERKQRDIYTAKYRRRDQTDKGKLSEIEIEREEECGICMEMNTKVVLPECNHSLCMRCYKKWWGNSFVLFLSVPLSFSCFYLYLSLECL